MGIFLSVLKTAKVTPVHKNDSKLEWNGYRPMTLLPNIEKYIEKLVCDRITNFLNNNNVIYPLQFGFRHNYSTDHALNNLTEDITKNLGEGKVGCGIFVDLEKAFDTVDLDVLLAKLEHYVIQGAANDSFKYYHSDRRHFVAVNRFNSNHAILNIKLCKGLNLDI